MLVDGVAGDEPDTRAVLVGQHSPAVVLLLVDSRVAVEGLADEHGVHRFGGGQFYARHAHRLHHANLVSRVVGRCSLA